MYPSKQLPSFPVNVLPAVSTVRETSPTKTFYSSSPTASPIIVGRRSPNCEVQMDAIAEDYTEDSSTPTETVPPTNINSAVDEIVQNPPSPSMCNGQLGFNNSSGQNYPRSIDDTKHRRSGATIYQSSMHPQMMTAVLQAKVDDSKRTISPKNSLHQLLSNNLTKTAPANQPQVLRNMLQSPINTQTSVIQSNPMNNSDYLQDPSAINGYNSTMMASMPRQSQNIIDDVSLLLMQQQLSNHKILSSHVSMVLNSFGMPFFHHNNVFTVQHLGVQFQIHVTNDIQLQYINGDTSQYQSLCSQLYNTLVSTVQ